MTTQPLRSWLVFTVIMFGVMAWVLGTIGDNLVVGFGATAGGLVWSIWKRCGSPERRAEAELIAEALRTYRDPGPADRETVDQQARVLLTSPPWAPWMALAVGAALATGCAVMAVIHSSRGAWLASAAALLGGAMLARAGLSDARAAERWLADLPYATEPQS